MRRNRPRARGNIVESIARDFLNTAAKNLLANFDSNMKARLGIGPSIEDMRATAALNRAEAQAEQARRRIGLDAIRAEQMAAQTKVRETQAEAQRAVLERRARLYDLEIAKQEIEIARRLQLLEAGKPEDGADVTVERAIKGALDYQASVAGLRGGTREDQRNFKAWLDSLSAGKILLLLGRRGAGKTCFSARLAEFMFASWRMPVFFVGLPGEAIAYLPSWINVVSDIERADLGAFVIVDESGIQFMASRYHSDVNTTMHKLLMISRHRTQSLLFISQVGADVDLAIVRQVDTIIYKEPPMMAPTNERRELRDIAKRAAKVFEDMPKDDRIKSAYVHDGEFTGLIQFDPPDFWREELSVSWGRVPLAEPKAGVTQISDVVGELQDADLTRRILELRKDGLGYKRISKALGVGTKVVRNRVSDIEESIDRDALGSGQPSD